MVKANIVYKDDRWKKIPLQKIAQSSLNLIVDKILHKEKQLEISILASNDFELAKLNKQYRGSSTPTNILAWPEHDFKRSTPGALPNYTSTSYSDFEGLDFIGNLAISFDRCSIESEETNIIFDNHLTHLLVHGCLHLIGFDHHDELDARLMEDVERKLLSELGIKNPYETIGR